MEKAKLFTNGRSQAVRLPKGCRFQGNEVAIKKVGNIVILYPADTAWDEFLSTEPVSDDFVDSILFARNNDQDTSRETL